MCVEDGFSQIQSHICLRNSVSFILQIKLFLKGWKNVNGLHSQNLGTATTQCSAKNKDYKLICCILKMEYFYRLLITVPFKMYAWEIWPTKMDFGQPHVEIGQKMANG